MIYIVFKLDSTRDILIILLVGSVGIVIYNSYQASFKDEPQHLRRTGRELHGGVTWGTARWSLTQQHHLYKQSQRKSPHRWAQGHSFHHIRRIRRNHWCKQHSTQIIAKRNIRMRGQAFLIFRDINSAMEAKRRNHGRELYGKTMVGGDPLRKFSSQGRNLTSLPRSTAPSSSERRTKMIFRWNSRKSLSSGHSSSARR